MTEALPTMILLNTVLDTQQVENMEDESLFQVILHPVRSTFLLQEVTMVTTLSTKILKLPKI